MPAEAIPFSDPHPRHERLDLRQGDSEPDGASAVPSTSITLSSPLPRPLRPQGRERPRAACVGPHRGLSHSRCGAAAANRRRGELPVRSLQRDVVSLGSSTAVFPLPCASGRRSAGGSLSWSRTLRPAYPDRKTRRPAKPLVTPAGHDRPAGDTEHARKRQRADPVRSAHCVASVNSETGEMHP